MLFLFGFIQVFLISLNTWQIAHQKYLSATIIAFLISLTWSFNVKKISISSWEDRILYSFGAACGTAFGFLIVNLLY
jgi:hypothetical protein